ncbi:MAG: phosphocholine cytidylyltransferase family protein [Balneolaceae bacterium]|nr:MAG: phosphocholine cytidylyltransferase family protein [Balneolaceae bacterium]
MKNKKMTAIILAAGQGTRLRPYTDHIPKCMVEVQGKPMIEWQIEILKSAGVDQIVAVTGYREDKITSDQVTKVFNPLFAETNMVYSLFCAEEFIEGDLLICYGDIVYSCENAEKLIGNLNDVVIAADDEWEKYWSERFDDPLSDAETFVKSPGNKVQSLGQKAQSADQIESQYIGLTRLSPKGCRIIRELYHEEKNNSDRRKNAWNSGRTIENAYMTDFLNYIAGLGNLHYQPIQGGWFEVDDPVDLKIAEQKISHLIR